MFSGKIIAAYNKFSQRNAFCIQKIFYTYRDLFTLVSSIQKEIETRYLAEQKFGVIINDDIETYAAILALLLSGKTYIPIHPRHPAERTKQIIEQSGLKLMLGKIPDSFEGVTALSIGEILIKNRLSDFPILNRAVAENDAYILFTSGSTGIPKGVPISYHNLDSFVGAFFELGYKVDENDRFLQMFDLTFDLSVMSFLIPVCLGACVYTVPDGGMKYLNVYNILEEHRITFALTVPSVLASLKPYFSEIELPSLKYSLFCGEALYKDLVTEWMKCAPNAAIENVYGPTEATIFCLVYKINSNEEIAAYNGIVTIGKPMHGMEAIVADENAVELSVGAKGELCLSGNQLTEGYLDVEKNMSVFFKHNDKKYYRTGDIAFKNYDGNFVYCGRVDNQVKIQGYRVELSEIEFHLRKITNNPNVAALFINNEVSGLNQIEIIFEGEKQDTEFIMNELKTKIPYYMMPANIHFVSSFPVNANGKTDRNVLKAMITELV